MVLGRQGLRLEAWKFGVYLIVPIVASVVFNNPERQRYWADYFQFLKYPANPNTNLKEQFEDYQQQFQKEKEQRQAYLEQMRALQESAKKSRQREEEAAAAKAKSTWFGW